MSFIINTLTVLTGIFLGCLTPRGLTQLFLRRNKAYWPEDFIEIYPHKKWVIVLHKVVIILGTVCIMISTTLFDYDIPSIKDDFSSSLYFSLYITYLSTGIGLINSFFEIFFSVSPKPVGHRVINGWGRSGVSISKYMADENSDKIRKIGMLRFLLSSLLMSSVINFMVIYF